MRPEHPLRLLLCATALLAAAGLPGCASRPNQQELQRLEKAREAAEAAEFQLEALKKERLELEKELARQQAILEERKKPAAAPSATPQ